MTDPSVADQAVLVTGGSMGIGEACATELARAGAKIVIAARGARELHGAAERLRKAGARQVIACATDVSDAHAVGELLDATVRLGTLKGVVHAAGIYGPVGVVPVTDPERWLEAMRINLFGTYLVAREACRRFIAAKTPGSIVLLAGGGAASPFPNYTAYAVSKVGVVRFAETLALEMKPHGIRVNTIAPGFVATRLHKQTIEAGEELAGAFYEETQKRLQDAVPPEVAARAAAFLISDRSADITGRFLAAAYDDYERWPSHDSELRDSDLFTLRRVVPRDRGKNWQ